MDTHSGSIVSTIVVDKREVNLKSPNMEKVGLQKSLTLLAGTLNVTELVTDAHTQIAAFLRKSFHILRVKKEQNKNYVFNGKCVLSHNDMKVILRFPFS